MRKSNLFVMFYCLPFLLFVHCKKGSDNTFVPNKLTYELNGQTFSDPTNGGPILDNYYRFIGFEIHDSALRGVLNYYIFPSQSGCAYLVQDNAAVTMSAGCQIDVMDPADSAKVYLFHSGSINYSFSNCKHKKAYDSGPGGVGRIEYDECAVSGTFSVTLANKNNGTIVITNGSFTFYPVRK